MLDGFCSSKMMFGKRTLIFFFLFLQCFVAFADTVCGGILELWRSKEVSYCTGLPGYSILDLTAEINKSCYCPEANLVLNNIHFNGSGTQDHMKQVFSADGRFLYVISELDSALNVYSRNTSSGELRALQSVRPTIEGLEALHQVNDIQISPDGLNIYTVNHHSLTTFQRDPASGQLHYLDMFEVSPVRNRGSTLLPELLVSPDGKHIYVHHQAYDPINYLDFISTIEVYNRGTNGRLSYHAVLPHTTDGLPNFSQFAIAPDGNHLYVTRSSDSLIATVARDASTGLITWQENIFPFHFSTPVSLMFSSNSARFYAMRNRNGPMMGFGRNLTTGALSGVQYVNPVSGITNATDTAMSADGTSVYFVSDDEGEISVYERDVVSGFLTHLESFQHGVNGLNMPGLLGAESVIVEPSGADVYVLGKEHDQIAHFRRNQQTGALTYVDYDDATSLGLINLPRHNKIVISHDQNHVYATDGNSIVRYDRESTHGTLAYGEKTPIAPRTNDERDRIDAIAISPDDRFVVVAGRRFIHVFQRGLASGELTFLRSLDGRFPPNNFSNIREITFSPNGRFFYSEGFDLGVFGFDLGSGIVRLLDWLEPDRMGGDGFYGLSDISISPDGRHLYASGQVENAIAIFERNLTTGLLTPLSVVKNLVGGVDGIEHVNNLAMSPDGLFLYTSTGSWQDQLAIFSRSPATGELSFIQTIRDFDQTDQITQSIDMAVSPNGKFLYVSGEKPNLTVYARNEASGSLSLIKDLTFTQTIRSQFELKLIVSPDSASVYVTRLFDFSLAGFKVFNTGD